MMLVLWWPEQHDARVLFLYHRGWQLLIQVPLSLVPPHPFSQPHIHAPHFTIIIPNHVPLFRSCKSSSHNVGLLPMMSTPVPSLEIAFLMWLRPQYCLYALTFYICLLNYTHHCPSTSQQQCWLKFSMLFLCAAYMLLWPDSLVTMSIGFDPLVDS